MLKVPILGVAALLCPEGLEGIVFTLFTSVELFASMLQEHLSALVMGWFSIDAHNFDAIVPARALTLALKLTPLLLLWLLPTQEEVDELCLKKSSKTVIEL